MEWEGTEIAEDADAEAPDMEKAEAKVVEEVDQDNAKKRLDNFVEMTSGWFDKVRAI